MYKGLAGAKWARERQWKRDRQTWAISAPHYDVHNRRPQMGRPQLNNPAQPSGWTSLWISRHLDAQCLVGHNSSADFKMPWSFYILDCGGKEGFLQWLPGHLLACLCLKDVVRQVSGLWGWGCKTISVKMFASFFTVPCVPDFFFLLLLHVRFFHKSSICSGTPELKQVLYLALWLASNCLSLQITQWQSVLHGTALHNPCVFLSPRLWRTYCMYRIG